MSTVFGRVTSKLRSLFTLFTSNDLVFDVFRTNAPITPRCLVKPGQSSCLRPKENRSLHTNGDDNAGIEILSEKPKNLKNDLWISMAQSPCASGSGAGTSVGPTKEKLKIGHGLFKMFVEKDGKMSLLNLFTRLKKTGLRISDPRLKPLMDGLKLNQQPDESLLINGTRLTSNEFREHLTFSSHALLSKAVRGHLAIKDFPAFCKIVDETYEKCKDTKSGKVATYIPQLAHVPPCNFGVSVCTVDGQRFSIGDVHVPFTLQSISKPLTYAMAHDFLGANVVHGFVGQEPSGRIFNELVLDNNNKPHNPMVNAGAIVVCSLLLELVQPEMPLADKFDSVSAYIKRLAGHERIGFNNSVYLSERDAADRNYAIAFLLRENRCFPPNVDLRNVMDFYFQCCSIDADCESMAVIAATLANGGTCPLTNERILCSESVRDTLSLMHSCGMYDYSGQFAFKVGIPAKSGVSGGVLAVIPEVLGLCCWSPALDPLGNSARGLQFCEEFVSSMNFHPYGMWGNDHNRHLLGYKYNKILDAAFVGDMATLDRVLQSGDDWTERDRDGRTALHIVAAEGHVEAARLLLKYGAESAACLKDKWGRIPLDEARHFDHEEIVKLLEPKSSKCMKS